MLGFEKFEVASMQRALPSQNYNQQSAPIMAPLGSKINMFGIFRGFDHKVLALERPIDLQIHQWTTGPICHTLRTEWSQVAECLGFPYERNNSYEGLSTRCEALLCR